MYCKVIVETNNSLIRMTRVIIRTVLFYRNNFKKTVRLIITNLK